MASGYLALMALCCCIKGVSAAAFAMVGKNNELHRVNVYLNPYTSRFGFILLAFTLRMFV